MNKGIYPSMCAQRWFIHSTISQKCCAKIFSVEKSTDKCFSLNKICVRRGLYVAPLTTRRCHDNETTREIEWEWREINDNDIRCYVIRLGPLFLGNNHKNFKMIIVIKISERWTQTIEMVEGDGNKTTIIK